MKPGGVARVSANKREDAEGPEALTAASYYDYKAKEDLTRPFFERESSRELIDAIASSSHLTLYAGAGVSADIGLPLNEALAPVLLGHELARHPMLAHVDEAKRKAAAQRVLNALPPAASSAYLMSIAREAATRERTRHAADSSLQDNVKGALMPGRKPGGFVARGLAALAFSMLHRGRSVQMVTTNFESGMIEEAQENLHTYFEDFTKYSLQPIWPEASDAIGTDLADRHHAAEADPEKVPVYYANGHVDASVGLFASELDFLPRDGALEPEQNLYRTREQLLDTAMAKHVCLFVGSSVTDPDTLLRLAKTLRSSKPRYAVILAPAHQVDQTLDPETAEAQADLDHELHRAAVELRFAHLNIIPITVDFPAQVPQLLRELALKVRYADDYVDYPNRLSAWWSHWREHFGFNPDGTYASVDRDLWRQLTWKNEVSGLRDDLQAFAKQQVPTGRQEHLMVELWIRDPDNRRLFLWASSNALWLNGPTALSGPVRLRDEPHYIAQSTFHEGRVEAGTLQRTRGHWKYYVSIPLILHEPPWHHLPVGVVNILSDGAPPRPDEADRRRGSRLYRLTTGDLAWNKVDGKRLPEVVAEKARARLNALLDPGENGEGVCEFERMVEETRRRAANTGHAGS